MDNVFEYHEILRSAGYMLAQEVRFPGQKVGYHWRFRRDTIGRWPGEGGQSEADES